MRENEFKSAKRCEMDISVFIGRKKAKCNYDRVVTEEHCICFHNIVYLYISEQIEKTARNS